METVESAKKIIEKLNQLQFRGLEDIEIGESLYYEIRYCDGKSIFREIRDMVKYMSTVSIEKASKGGGKYLLVGEKDNARLDHITWLKKIYQTIDDATIYVMWNKSDGKKHRENYKYLKNILPWFAQMRRIKGLSFRKCFHLACWLAARYPFYQMVMEQAKSMKELQCIITLCDIHCCSSLLTQTMNEKKIQTVTVAHSHFTDEHAWIYCNSHSNHMILYSELMRKNAIKENADGKYHVLGDPRCIGMSFKQNVAITKNRVLGVLLSYGLGSDENRLIMESAIACAKRRGYSLKVKIHPTERDKTFPYDLSDVKATTTAELGVPIANFIEDCDAVITGASNVFFECVVMLKVTFLAESGNAYYEPIKWCKFSNELELDVLIEKYLEEQNEVYDKLVALRNEVMLVEDIQQNYRAFFKQVIENSRYNE